MIGENHPRPDVTLHLDREGVIQRAVLSVGMPGEGLEEWVGRPWCETVDSAASQILTRMVADARDMGVSALHQVSQRFPSGHSIPIEYTTVLLGAQAGLVAVGRSLQAVTELQSRLVEAQQAMERDYWKLREIETRYRLLFRSSTDAVLLLRSGTLSILDLNPVAAAALALPSIRPNALGGRELLPLLPSAERNLFQSMLAQVAEQGAAPSIILHLGTGSVAWAVRASLLSSESGAVYLLQLTPTQVSACPESSVDALPTTLLIERMPDGFVVTDRSGLIQQANRGCLDLIQMPTERSVMHQTLGRWLGRPGADLAVLLANVQRLGAVRLFSTVIHGELGTETDVEISAAGNLDADPEFIGVLIRDVGRRLPSMAESCRLGDRLGVLTGKIGKHALRALVEETVGLVERHYIEEALELTSGNRTATAELLGLSRQSLYVKLNRYGLDSDSAKHHDGIVE